ncbi:TetR/AcrR family transcriptional regulator [Sciscionella marina]|uniref:TetR/AcrR family transcriptional regulator n=1 Tax=Sciscionella marina TaxID=508770 RepID=UPI00037767F5|nr:TetR/AcrR family transcriptional regulator [Sciscionella marina]
MTENELRADAQRNRDRILEAASEAFAARGLDVPLAAIARRAGVGAATLYRRFPTREALVTEVFYEQLAECGAELEQALADPDPWRGFRQALENVCATQVTDRGFTAALLTSFPNATEFEEQRVRAEQILDELMRRAKESGRLRPEFTRSDITLLLMANSGLTAEEPEAAIAASHRLVAYLMQAFQTGSGEPLPPPAPLGLYSFVRAG